MKLCWLIKLEKKLFKNTQNLIGCIILIKQFLYFKVELSRSKKFVLIYFNKSPLKMMRNGFYFILKALFVLKIFTFFS